MKMKFEKYFRPTTVQEALDLMKEYGTDCKVIAGGTDVVIRLRARTLRVQAIIDISAIPELKGITLSKDKAVIGAAHDLRACRSIQPCWKVSGKSLRNVLDMYPAHRFVIWQHWAATMLMHLRVQIPHRLC